MRPLGRLATAARAMARGDRSARSGVRAPGELGDLGRAFDTMVAEVSRAEQARRNLTADVAHELRTPLATLRAGLEELRDGFADPDPARLTSLHDQTLRLGRVVEDLSELAAAESAAPSLRLADVDLAALARAELASHAPRLEAVGLAARVELAEGVVVRADADRLHQALGNLLDNAERYLRAGDSVTVRVFTTGGEAVVQVADSGPGIPNDELPHVFDRLWRGRRPSGCRGLGHRPGGRPRAGDRARGHRRSGLRAGRRSHVHHPATRAVTRARVADAHLLPAGQGATGSAEANSRKAAKARGPYTVAGPPFINSATPSASATSASVAPLTAAPWACAAIQPSHSRVTAMASARSSWSWCPVRQAQERPRAVAGPPGHPSRHRRPAPRRAPLLRVPVSRRSPPRVPGAVDISARGEALRHYADGTGQRYPDGYRCRHLSSDTRRRRTPAPGRRREQDRQQRPHRTDNEPEAPKPPSCRGWYRSSGSMGTRVRTGLSHDAIAHRARSPECEDFVEEGFDVALNDRLVRVRA